MLRLILKFDRTIQGLNTVTYPVFYSLKKAVSKRGFLRSRLLKGLKRMKGEKGVNVLKWVYLQCGVKRGEHLFSDKASERSVNLCWKWYKQLYWKENIISRSTKYQKKTETDVKRQNLNWVSDANNNIIWWTLIGRQDEGEGGGWSGDQLIVDKRTFPPKLRQLERPSLLLCFDHNWRVHLTSKV